MRKYFRFLTILVVFLVVASLIVEVGSFLAGLWFLKQLLAVWG